MKIILSRKGLDSRSGGFPSPIFSNGKMVPLPVPDKQSRIKYGDVRMNGYDLGGLVAALSRGAMTSDDRAHLDPDLVSDSLDRGSEWRPFFGQAGVSQDHLKKEGVGANDLFIFFGPFQNVLNVGGEMVFNHNDRERHVMWGWMQADAAIEVNTDHEKDFQWVHYNLHYKKHKESNYTLYLAKQFLNLPGMKTEHTGAGIFRSFGADLQLTNPDGDKVNDWRLPKWFYPREGAKPLTYHGEINRWSRGGQYCYLDSVSRGQEFVLDCAEYPESIGWVHDLISRFG